MLLRSATKWITKDPDPSPTPVQVLETPSKRSRMMSPHFQIESLAEKRMDVYSEVYPSSILVQPDFFFKKILPPLHPSIRVNRVIKLLEKQGVIKGSRFAAFDVDPSAADKIENVVFGNLEGLVDSIVNSVKVQGLRPTMKYVCNPNGVPKSTNRTSRARPDGYVMEIDASTEDVEWSSIAIAGEFKKESKLEKKKDNDIKTLWSMYHCMCEDQRRRFCLGFAIEDYFLRFWFLNRELCINSTPFKWITNYELTIRFFLSVLFAQPHLLGWDPTMERLPNGQFDITVHSSQHGHQCYRTEQLLSDFGANTTFGRGTRVWKARKLVNNVPTGPYVVVKDIWIDDDRPREGYIYERLEKKGALNHYFLRVLIHGDVWIDVAKMRDHTRILALRNAKVPRFNENEALAYLNDGKRSNDTVITAVGYYLNPDDSAPPSETPHPKMHYRVVGNGVYTPLYQVTSFGDICLALSEVCWAVHTLHVNGWVHRDIHPGNILIRKTPSGMEVKLCDLEYAKSMSATTGHTVRSGACEFRAVEAALQTYQFGGKNIPEQREKPTGGVLDWGDKYMDKAVTKVNEVLALLLRKRFRFNVLHDLESLWWVCVWFVFDKEVHYEGERHEVTQQQDALAKKIFYAADATVDRLKLFSHDGAFEAEIFQLHPSVRFVAAVLNELRVSLLATYREAEQDLASIDGTVGDQLVAEFSDMFQKLSVALQARELNMYKIPRKGNAQDSSPDTQKRASPPIAPQTSSQKRKATTSSIDSDDTRTSSSEDRPQAVRAPPVKKARRVRFK